MFTVDGIYDRLGLSGQKGGATPSFMCGSEPSWNHLSSSSSIHQELLEGHMWQPCSRSYTRYTPPVLGYLPRLPAAAHPSWHVVARVGPFFLRGEAGFKWIFHCAIWGMGTAKVFVMYKILIILYYPQNSSYKSWKLFFTSISSLCHLMYCHVTHHEVR